MVPGHYDNTVKDVSIWKIPLDMVMTWFVEEKDLLNVMPANAMLW